MDLEFNIRDLCGRIVRSADTQHNYDTCCYGKGKLQSMDLQGEIVLCLVGLHQHTPTA